MSSSRKKKTNKQLKTYLSVLVPLLAVLLLLAGLRPKIQIPMPPARSQNPVPRQRSYIPPIPPTMLFWALMCPSIRKMWTGSKSKHPV